MRLFKTHKGTGIAVEEGLVVERVRVGELSLVEQEGSRKNVLRRELMINSCRVEVPASYLFVHHTEIRGIASGKNRAIRHVPELKERRHRRVDRDISRRQNSLARVE